MVKQMKKKKLLIFCLIFLSNNIYLSAVSLENLVNQAIEKSPQITTLELNKNYTMLNIESSELEEKTKVGVSTDVEIPESDEYIIKGGDYGLLSIEIPGSYTPTSPTQVSNTTSIVVNGGIYKSDDLDYVGSLSVSHNFLIGDYTNNYKTLNNQITSLIATQAYETGLINFKKNLYNMVSNIINNEKSQRDVEKKIKDQEKLINDSLTLNRITEDSLLYKQYNLVLNTYKDSLDNLKIQHESILQNFKDYTGVDYDTVDIIREPVLNLDTDNSESLSVQIAQLKVKLKQETIDQVEREKTQSYLKLGSTAATNYVDDNLDITASASYNTDNFSISVNPTLSIDLSDSSLSPSFSFGGKWINDTTTDRDLIKNKLNENELVSSQLDLNSAIQNQSLTTLNLKSQITNWQAQYKQLNDNIKFKNENLLLQMQMFDLGLVSQSEIDDLVFEIEQLNYDKLILLLDGLSIELDIEKMML